MPSRGLTIDTISCVSIVLVIGLCVDYNSHIAHAYIVSFGSSRERATNALTEIGPAVLNGAITTFLALIFLSFSQGYAFIVFFRFDECKFDCTFKRIGSKTLQLTKWVPLVERTQPTLPCVTSLDS